jgi:hypothetical protein
LFASGDSKTTAQLVPCRGGIRLPCSLLPLLLANDLTTSLDSRPASLGHDHLPLRLVRPGASAAAMIQSEVPGRYVGACLRHRALVLRTKSLGLGPTGFDPLR